MKALVLKDYNKLVFEEVPEPDIADNEVLIKVQACGICGSDVHGMDGSTGRRRPPVIMGHEASGSIVDIGGSVANWKAGDRVTFDSTVYCGHCDYCRKGQINLCDNRMVLGVSCADFRRNGAFAEYVAVPQHILYPLPQQLEFERAALVEAISIAVHAAEITPIALMDTAVVMGSGMIGLLLIQVLRNAGCGTIIAVDVEDDKLELAKELGADIGLNPTQCDVVDEVRRLTNGRGADVGFEVVGITETVVTGIESLRKGGTFTLVGNLSPKVEFPLQAVVTRQIHVIGSCASCGEYPACLKLLADGKINVDKIISATAPLQEGAGWFDRLYNKEKGLMKVVLKPNG